MSNLSRIAVLLSLSFVVVGAHAAGTGYHSAPKTFKGGIAVKSASGGAAIGEAFVVTRNAPTSSAQLAMRLIEPESARKLEMTDSSGHASLSILPLGVFSVWKPGYWPEEIKFRIRSNRPIDENGTMTIELKPVADDPHDVGSVAGAKDGAGATAEKTAAGRKAAELFGFIRSDGQLSTFANSEKDPSEHIRGVMRKILEEAGILPVR